jgi:hypothetical protein
MGINIPEVERQKASKALNCDRQCPLWVISGHFLIYAITSSAQASSILVHTAAVVGIFAHWPYLLTSTSEFE